MIAVVVVDICKGTLHVCVCFPYNVGESNFVHNEHKKAKACVIITVHICSMFQVAFTQIKSPTYMRVFLPPQMEIFLGKLQRSYLCAASSAATKDPLMMICAIITNENIPSLIYKSYCHFKIIFRNLSFLITS